MMWIRNYLFGKPPIVQDSYFGKLSFVKARKGRDSYFEGRFHFKPTNSQIELWLESDLDALTETQRSFVERIQQNYELIKHESSRLITDEFRHWKYEFVIVDFDGEFTPVYLFINRLLEGQKQNWEIAFESIHDLAHTITVSFEDWQAINVLMDG